MNNSSFFQVFRVVAPIAAANLQIGVVTFLNNVVIGSANFLRDIIIGVENVISGGDHDSGGLLGLIAKATENAVKSDNKNRD